MQYIPFTRLAAASLPLLLALSLAAPARANGDEPPAKSFAALEAAGVRIGEIRVRAEDIFDTSGAREDNWLFRLANKLHIQTRPEVIERALLFKRGESVSVRLIEETERLFRGQLLAGPSRREIQTRRRKPATRGYIEARFSGALGRTACGRLPIDASVRCPAAQFERQLSGDEIARATGGRRP